MKLQPVFQPSLAHGVACTTTAALLCPALGLAFSISAGCPRQGGGALPFLHFKGLTAPCLLSPFLFVAEFGSVLQHSPSPSPLFYFPWIELQI